MSRKAKKCVYCSKALNPERDGEKHHRACVEAYGLDYDPKSEADAQAFLARRAKLMKEAGIES